MPIEPLDCPFCVFQNLARGRNSVEPEDPNAMALATVNGSGQPSVRMVLLKAIEEEAFIFYSHATSQKGRELQAHPKAALLFHWKSLRRQIRLEGTVSQAPVAAAEAYFATRPRRSQLGALASDQSAPLDSRDSLLARLEGLEARYPEGPVPRPPAWVGWQFRPDRFEFWLHQENRLHDRYVFERAPHAPTAQSPPDAPPDVTPGSLPGNPPSRDWHRVRLYP